MPAHCWPRKPRPLPLPLLLWGRLSPPPPQPPQQQQQWQRQWQWQPQPQRRQPQPQPQPQPPDGDGQLSHSSPKWASSHPSEPLPPPGLKTPPTHARPNCNPIGINVCRVNNKEHQNKSATQRGHGAGRQNRHTHEGRNSS